MSGKCIHEHLSTQDVTWGWPFKIFGRIRLYCKDCDAEFKFAEYWSMVIMRDTLAELGYDWKA